jgi:hypothetical protein
LKFYLGLLKNDAQRVSNEANEILKCHVRFVSLMAQWIDGISEANKYVLEYDDLEMARLARDISSKADLLLTKVTNMKYNLKSFVDALEKAQFSRIERLLAFVKSLFEAISRALAKVCPVTANFLHCFDHPRAQNLVPVVSALGMVAQEFLPADPGVFLEHIILPLQGQK